MTQRLRHIASRQQKLVAPTGASAVEFGFNLSGENRVQEAKAKIPLDECMFHLV
jgi:hypothetical protein